jgi:hypothetical protein
MVMAMALASVLTALDSLPGIVESLTIKCNEREEISYWVPFITEWGALAREFLEKRAVEFEELNPEFEENIIIEQSQHLRYLKQLDLIIHQLPDESQRLFYQALDRQESTLAGVLQFDPHVALSDEHREKYVKVAALANSIQMLKMLCETAVNKINLLTIALENASMRGNVAVVDWALQQLKNASTGFYDYVLYSSLEKASANGRVAVVKRLLQEAAIDPSRYNNSALFLASYHDRRDVVKLLKADPRIRLSWFERYFTY